MAEPLNESKSWWVTLPGVLAGLAALIGAVGGLYAVIEGKSIPQSPPSKIVTPTSSSLSDPCKKLPIDDRPISCLGDEK